MTLAAPLDSLSPSATRGAAPRALIMAGGTGGHIFPGLAIALELRSRGWDPLWLGAPGTSERPSMESRLVPPQGIPFLPVSFGAARGKGISGLATTPFRLAKACSEAKALLREHRPDVVIGMGGYISAPGGLAARMLGIPLFIHEQNAIPGLANRLLSSVATRSFCAFPNGIRSGTWSGNPLRPEFLAHPDPAARFAGRSGPLRLLVLGGSLGASRLNETLPLALAAMDPERRPIVIHQSGEAHAKALETGYAQARVQATVSPFIVDVASAMAQADLIICRSGASTVSELAAIGAAALMVPYPSATDDHQTANAKFLVDANAGWTLPQSELDPSRLASWLLSIKRSDLERRATRAHALRMPGAAALIADACDGLIATPAPRRLATP